MAWPVRVSEEGSSTYADIARAGKEISELVERGGHDSVCRVESLFDSVATTGVVGQSGDVKAKTTTQRDALVNIDVDVKYTRVVADSTGVRSDAMPSRERQRTHRRNSRIARTMSLM